ncbi:MAG: hypothetical protein WD738_22155 [Pirellulales bacterium]
MHRIIRTAVGSAVTVVSFCFLAGCNQSPSPESASSSANTPASQSTDAVARAAGDFLDAVLKGDTQRASARLTPQAMQRIIASGKQFDPPGLESATFRVVQVRTPAAGQALVQCVLTDTSVADAPRDEEMCCLMRFVDNDWRVSGIAYGTSADQPWTLSNFETGQNVAIPRQSSVQNPAVTPADPSAPGSRPSPPRTAQESAAAIR